MPNREPLNYRRPVRRKRANTLLGVLLFSCVLWTAASAFGATFTNPIISDGADP